MERAVWQAGARTAARNPKRRKRCIFGVLACYSLLMPASGWGQSNLQEEFQSVHWAYSSLFGTGWYQIDNNREVYVLRVSSRQYLRESTLEDTGWRSWGVEVRYPFTVGFHNIEDLPGIIEPDNFGTLSFTPGLELEIPINERFALRPNAFFGYGYNFEEETDAWIWQANLKGQYTIPRGSANWRLMGALNYAGYNSDDGTDDDIAGLNAGFGATHASSGSFWKFGRFETHWHLMYTWMNKELKFINPEAPSGFNVVDDFFEVALSFSPSGKRYGIPLWRPLQLGLAFQVAPDGDYVAIRFISRDWFSY